MLGSTVWNCGKNLCRFDLKVWESYDSHYQISLVCDHHILNKKIWFRTYWGLILLARVKRLIKEHIKDGYQVAFIGINIDMNVTHMNQFTVLYSTQQIMLLLYRRRRVLLFVKQRFMNIVGPWVEVEVSCAFLTTFWPMKLVLSLKFC